MFNKMKTQNDILYKLKIKQMPSSIDEDKRFKNLSKGYWVYDELLISMAKRGWVRFAPGFKAGLYTHPNEKWCIKVLGMGVGDNPLYFCEKGDYLEHERNMLSALKQKGFTFQPDIMQKDKASDFLKSACGLSEDQAKLRLKNNDILIMEYIQGVPFAVQTGHYLNYDIDYSISSKKFLLKMIEALRLLRKKLDQANQKGILNNDPMPPNIIFTLNGKILSARLVDFELAQDLNQKSPDFVNSSVEELYKERNVPLNLQTQKHIKNLDQHLLDESFQKLKDLPVADNKPFLGKINFDIPYTDISVNVGDILDGIDDIIVE